MEAVSQRLGSSWMERHGIKFRAMKTANDWHDLTCEVCSKVRGQDCLLWTGNVEDHIQSKKHKNAVSWSLPVPEATHAAPHFAAPTAAAAQQAWFGPPSREREGASSVGGGASDMAPSFASSVSMSTNTESRSTEVPGGEGGGVGGGGEHGPEVPPPPPQYPRRTPFCSPPPPPPPLLHAPSSATSVETISSVSSLYLSAPDSERCFLPDAVVFVYDYHGRHLRRVSELETDMIVGGVDCLLQVRAKNVWTGRHEVVELTVGEGVPSLTVTASHRVVKSLDRKANTVRAGELVAGDEVMTGDVSDASRAGKDLPLQDLLHKKVLKDCRKYFTDVGVIQLQFNPDKPVLAFDMPSCLIMTKGQNTIRRAKQQPLASSIPDTDSEIFWT